MAKEESTPPLSKGANRELGASGTLIAAGHIINEDYNRRLSGLQGIRQYEIMRRSDATVHAALQVVKLPLLSAVWDIAAAENAKGEVEDQDDYIAQMVKHNIFEVIRFKRWLKSGLTKYDFGFSVSEKVWNAFEFDGKPYIGCELKPRKQTSIISWQTKDGQPGITQIVGGNTYYIPMDQLLIMSYDREGDNYEGVSLLRYVYKDWDMKDKLTLVNAMALEKLGMGVPVVQAKNPDEAPNPTDEADAIAALENWRAHNRSYLKVPASMTVEFMNLQGQSTREILPTLTYHDGRIMSGVLARFMEIGGHSGSGSQSLASTLENFFMRAQEAEAQEIIETFNDFIKEIVDQNYGKGSLPNGYPKMTVSNITDDDMSALATNVATLMNAGAISKDADIEENLRDRYNLPAMSEDMRENYGQTVTDPEGKDAAGTTAKDQTVKDKVTKKAIDELKASDREGLQASIAKIRAYREQLLLGAA